MSVGEISTASGNVQIKAFLKIKRDERESVMLHLEDGAFAFQTTSWLPQNDHKEVSLNMIFTEKTLVLLLESIHLGCLYFGIDIESMMKKMAYENDGNIDCEYGGNGEFVVDKNNGK